MLLSTHINLMHLTSWLFEKGKIFGQIELLEKFNAIKMLAKDQYNQMMQSLKSQLHEISQSNQQVQMAS